LLPPEQLFLTDEAFFTAAKCYGRLVFSAKTENPAATALPDIAVDRRAEDPLGKLKNHLASFKGRVLLLAESAGRRETLATMLTEHGLRPATSADFAGFAATDAPLALGVGPLHGGFALPNLAFITETELYAGAPRRTRREAARKASFDNWLKDLTELKVGDPVVHESHGIGRYRGLIRMDLGNGEQEFLELHYANEAKLFVPVAQLHVISRYSGAEPEAAPLHTLGSGQWEKAKRKAAEQARDTAAELLTLYAARAARQGHAFEFQENDYEAFADGFGFEETADQAQAIAAVIEDMRSGKPMDRLVCGDVGFGKTEVALRAAFCAVAGGKQVAVLCPTTLLCEQHYQTFVDRFADWPVKIAEISRFKTAKESAQALAGAGRRQDRHHHRHAQADRQGRQVQAPRPGRHRRGTPFRRAPEGNAEGDARRGRRADPDRDADPAHAGDVDGRPARLLGDRHRSAETAGDQDLRQQVLRRHHPRSRAARTEARRPGVFPAQRGRHHREHAGKAGKTGARGAHRDRPRPDERARAGARDARLHPASAPTCCCARPSSKPASTTRTPTPS
jgi:hypothetical protein